MWSCVACTYENVPARTVCEICETPRPAAASQRPVVASPIPTPVPAAASAAVPNHPAALAPAQTNAASMPAKQPAPPSPALPQSQSLLLQKEFEEKRQRELRELAKKAREEALEEARKAKEEREARERTRLLEVAERQRQKLLESPPHHDSTLAKLMPSVSSPQSPIADHVARLSISSPRPTTTVHTSSSSSSAAASPTSAATQQYHPYNNMSIATLIPNIQVEHDVARAKACLPILRKITENVLSGNPKFRKISKNSEKIQNILLRTPIAVEILARLGFMNSEHHLTIPDEVKIPESLCKDVLSVIGKQLSVLSDSPIRKYWPRWVDSLAYTPTSSTSNTTNTLTPTSVSVDTSSLMDDNAASATNHVSTGAPATAKAKGGITTAAGQLLDVSPAVLLLCSLEMRNTIANALSASTAATKTEFSNFCSLDMSTDVYIHHLSQLPGCPETLAALGYHVSRSGTFLTVDEVPAALFEASLHDLDAIIRELKPHTRLVGAASFMLQKYGRDALLPLLSRLRHQLLHDLRRAPLEPKYHRINLQRLCPGPKPQGLVSLLRCFGYGFVREMDGEMDGEGAGHRADEDVMTTGLGHRRFDVDMLNMNIDLFDEVFGDVPTHVEVEDKWSW